MWHIRFIVDRCGRGDGIRLEDAGSAHSGSHNDGSSVKHSALSQAAQHCQSEEKTAGSSGIRCTLPQQLGSEVRSPFVLYSRVCELNDPKQRKSGVICKDVDELIQQLHNKGILFSVC